MSPILTPEDRALELLVDHATEGLDPIAAGELDDLIERLGDFDAEAFELAAAAVDLAHTVSDEPLPDRLRERLSEQATAFFAGEEA